MLDNFSSSREMCSHSVEHETDWILLVFWGLNLCEHHYTPGYVGDVITLWESHSIPGLFCSYVIGISSFRKHAYQSWIVLSFSVIYYGGGRPVCWAGSSSHRPDRWVWRAETFRRETKTPSVWGGSSGRAFIPLWGNSLHSWTKDKEASGPSSATHAHTERRRERWGVRCKQHHGPRAQRQDPVHHMACGGRWRALRAADGIPSLRDAWGGRGVRCRGGLGVAAKCINYSPRRIGCAASY